MPSDDRVSKRLDRGWVAQWNRDPVFDLLAVISEGLPVAIGMLVDGKVVRGVITPDSLLIEAATAAVARPLEAFGAAWHDELKKTYAESFTRQSEQEAARRTEHRELLNRYLEQATRPSIDIIEDEDVTAFYRELIGPPTLTIGQARLEVHGSTISIDVLSVRRDSISAWWFLDSEEGPPVNYASNS